MMPPLWQRLTRCPLAGPPQAQAYSHMPPHWRCLPAADSQRKNLNKPMFPYRGFHRVHQVLAFMPAHPRQENNKHVVPLNPLISHVHAFVVQ